MKKTKFIENDKVKEKAIFIDKMESLQNVPISYSKYSLPYMLRLYNKRCVKFILTAFAFFFYSFSYTYTVKEKRRTKRYYAYYVPKVCNEISLIFCTNVAYNSEVNTSYGLVVTLCVWWRSQHQT